MVCLFARFPSYRPERSPASSAWVEVDSDECNLECWAFLILLWWRSDTPYSSKSYVAVIVAYATLTLLIFPSIIPLLAIAKAHCGISGEYVKQWQSK